MAGHILPGKAKDILSHGEVRGHPLTDKQRRYMGARASGLPEKNAPLFPIPSDEGMEGVTPQEREPLTGPVGSFVGDPTSVFGGKTAYGFDGKDAATINAPHPSQPLGDGDFPTDATFDKGTSRHLNTGGVG